MVTRNPTAAFEYCQKPDGDGSKRIEGPIMHGIPPPRLNVIGEKAEFNKKCLAIGAE